MEGAPHPPSPHWCRVTDNEPRAAIMRVIANGGRASEKLGVGPDGFGAVVIGERGGHVWS